MAELHSTLSRACNAANRPPCFPCARRPSFFALFAGFRFATARLLAHKKPFAKLEESPAPSAFLAFACRAISQHPSLLSPHSFPRSSVRLVRRTYAPDTLTPPRSTSPSSTSLQSSSIASPPRHFWEADALGVQKLMRAHIAAILPSFNLWFDDGPV